ncbi:MAG: cyanophycin synthetase, partial [Candidatus Omnitrophota bacterium]|nr:cyanophycin synthetase [Candidatus Omnitrophota bacterium]
IVNPNFLASLAVGKIFGVSRKRCLEAFNNFKGVEHRLEFVSSIRGVDFVNDSKATTVESAIWALSIANKPVIMIAGGKDKKLDYTPIKDLIQQKVKKVILIGEAKEKIKKALSTAVPISEAGSLEEAVQQAFNDAQKGDCILLCPMCASFDMFANFEERGRIFKKLVQELKLNARD